MAKPRNGLKALTSFALLVLAAILTLSSQSQAHPRWPIPPSQTTGDQSLGSFLAALQTALTERGLSEREAGELLYLAVKEMLPSPPMSSSKRSSGWSRIPIQTRFAPFGTKLVPSRNRGEANRPTLLRYGRSV